MHTSNLSQAIVSEYIRLGYYKPHVKEICALYRAQRDGMADAIENIFRKKFRCCTPQADCSCGERSQMGCAQKTCLRFVWKRR